MNKKQEMITIPFNVEMAKQITNGELPGEIVTKEGNSVRIICWDRNYKEFPIVVLMEYNKKEELYKYTQEGYIKRNSVLSPYNLQLRVPEWTQYRDGDIVYCENSIGTTWISVIKGKVCCSKRESKTLQLEVHEYVSCILLGSDEGHMYYNAYSGGIDYIRRATDNERELLVDMLKNDKYQSEQAKEILKNHFNIEVEEETEEVKTIKAEHQFQPFDKVLMRNEDDHKWRAVLFSHYTESKYYPYCSACGPYSQCIPYNEQTKHLVGTAGNWEE